MIDSQAPPSPSFAFARGAVALTATAIVVLAAFAAAVWWRGDVTALAAPALGVGIVWLTMMLALSAAAVVVRLDPGSAGAVLCGLAGFRMVSCAAAVLLLGRLTPLAMGPLALGVVAAYIPSLAVETAILVRAASHAAEARGTR
jgi:hypothetical protein